jgi:DNA helicase-2/ATP-dependent DNA helicase PcrA
MNYTRGERFTATPEQSNAICHDPAPLMILAGAGTGKTTTLLYRFVYLIENLKIKPKEILAITYTDRAARELTERLVKELGTKVRDSTISTFHSFCYNLIQEYGSHENQPQLIEESESVYLILNNFDNLRPYHSDEFPLNPHKSVGEAIPFINRCRDEMISPEDMDVNLLENSMISIEKINQLNDIRNIFEFYQNIKKKLGLVDYGDMIFQAWSLLKNDPSVLAKIQKKIHHIIIDEFQDNNYALNQVIGLIAEKNKSITAVGDDDQTIYSFRGASKYNLDFFKKRYQTHPKYQRVTLGTSFRSHQQILNAANNVIKNNYERMDKNLVSFENKTGPKPKLLYADMDVHPEIILKMVKDYLSKGYPLKEVAILCRSIAKAKSMLLYLQKSRIPVANRFVKYFEIESIKILNSWCQVVGRGTYQDSAFFHLMKINMGLNEAIRWIQCIKKRSKFSVMDQILRSNIDSEFPKTLSDLIRNVKSLQNQSIKKTAGETIWDICVQTELLRPLIKRYDYFDQLSLINVGHFIKKAQQFSSREKENRGLREFNMYLETLMETGGISVKYPEDNRKTDTVTISTIHGVKGGEFSIVFIPFNRSGSFPTNFKQKPVISKPPDEWMHYTSHTNLSPKEHHYEEERRLFYVAVTRAKEHLILLAPKKATSVFIKELDKSLIEEEEMEPIKTENSTLKTQTGLREVYEQKLQNSLAKDNFERAQNMISALKTIRDLERGIPFKTGNVSDWEKELIVDMEKYDIKSDIEEIYLSATAIETYKSCPLKYRLSFQDNVPESASKPQMAFGSIIHKVLQRFHEPEKKLTEERILLLLDEEWKPEEFDYLAREEKFRDQGKSILIEYAKRTIENPPNVLKREEPFEFSLDDNILIRGKIDRIDEIKNGTSVIDYKTSKTPSKAEKNIQLAVYCLYLAQAVEENIKGIPASASLYFLREKEEPMRSHSFSEDELNDTKEIILDIAQKIRANLFEPKTGFHCNWCDYKHLLCPEWETKV